MRPRHFQHKLLILLLNIFGYTDGAKILLLPAGLTDSHIHLFAKMSKELLKRGHITEMAVSGQAATSAGMETWRTSVSSIHIYNKELPKGDNSQLRAVIMSLVKGAMTEDHVLMKQAFSRGDDIYHQDVVELLKDEVLMSRIQKGNFDLAIVDGFFFTKPIYIVPYKFSIPYITFDSIFVDVYNVKSPVLPSFVPVKLMGQYTDCMSFFERLHNAYLLIKIAYMFNVKSDDDLVKTYAPDKQFKTIPEIVQQSQFWLFNVDHILDYPRPLMPNMVSVPGIGIEKPQPLEGELRKFAESARNGLILVSFGTMIGEIEEHILNVFLNTFEKLKYKVIWRYVGDMNITSDNILVVKWLPQNDILGHSNTKLFITHCGNNGQIESLYHGIPLLGLPVFGDQQFNAKRMENKRYGKSMKWKSVNKENLKNNIEAVIQSEIKDKVVKMSMILKSRRPAVEIAGDWMEHILEYGGDYLKSAAMNMSWYQILMLDIMTFLLTILTIGLAISLSIVFYCIKRCTISKKTKHKTT